MLRARAAARVQEPLAVEAWEEQKANIWAGLPIDRVPAGMTPSQVMLSAAAADTPRRRNPVQAALDGESMSYHSYMPDAS